MNALNLSGEITQILNVKLLSTGALDCTFKMREPMPENAPEGYKPIEVQVDMKNPSKQAHPDCTEAFKRLCIHLARYTGQMGPLVNLPLETLAKSPKPKGKKFDLEMEQWRNSQVNAEFWESLSGKLRVNSITFAKGSREQIKIMGQVEEQIGGGTVALNTPLIDLEHARYLFLDELADDLAAVTKEVRLYLSGKYRDAQGNLFEPVPDPADGKLRLAPGAQLSQPAPEGKEEDDAG